MKILTFQVLYRRANGRLRGLFFKHHFAVSPSARCIAVNF
jgi:hypothetical protein